MVRTQIYLTTAERDSLANLSKQTSKKQSELIREAIDQFLGGAVRANREAAMAAAAGMWKDRKDLPDFRALRKGWSRRRNRD